MRSRLWAEVSLATIVENARTLRELFGDQGVLAVVKANAYGHGLIPVARACVSGGLSAFGVATLEEGLALRRAGISAALHTLAPLLPEEAEDVVRADIVPFISSRAFFDAFSRAAVRAPLPAACFLVVDTGMGREGLTLGEAHALLREHGGVEVRGLSTHFSSADEPALAPTEAQRVVFQQLIESLGAQVNPLQLSLSNSPGMLRTRQVELCRAGLLLYGIAPYAGALHGLALRPALSLHARVTLLKDLPRGATIGYGQTHTLTRASRIATVPAGYGDGWLRTLSNRGEVLIGGQRCPIVGRVSMDQCQVDVTEVPTVDIGDLVTLIGSDGQERITAAELAQWAETTPHEPTTLLSGRVPRYYT